MLHISSNSKPPYYTTMQQIIHRVNSKIPNCRMHKLAEIKKDLAPFYKERTLQNSQKAFQ